MRILVVAMANSIHTARWLSQIADQGWDVHLFHVLDVEPHEDLRDATIYVRARPRSWKLHPSVRVRATWPVPGAARWPAHPRSRPARLAAVIRRLEPDVLHSMEIQHSAYLTLEAKRRGPGPFPPWLVTSWGSDLSLFGRLPAHAPRIREVLGSCQFFHADCERDVALAQRAGFRGHSFPVLPAAGGFEIGSMQRFRDDPPSRRRRILLKGYQHWAGRALVGVRALELCADVLAGYRVTVYAAHPDVVLAAKLLQHSAGVVVETSGFGASALSRADLLRAQGSARLSIGLSISDGLSTSLLESMIMGSLPIQSDTGCADEWLRHEENLLFVPPQDPSAVAEAIRRGLRDDDLVDRVAGANGRAARARLDASVVTPQVVAMYEQIARTWRRSRSS